MDNRYTVHPPKSQADLAAWYVKDNLTPEGCAPAVVAICSSEALARLVAAALTAHSVRHAGTAGAPDNASDTASCQRAAREGVRLV